ncbi:FHA domain-containing protein [Thiorhodovibrio frisius]|uniref:FHA domain-containing protein n=1 Tax=Thiorhodovibrio frisius TaxID=631362 RepID=H8YZZ0_9GAMM|nr:FHA domain-containing protein [Thiorhodovibrio frisius]EIC21163.1 FHA domain-containing protein [Thiorhodovibrio frisius]WPL23738.1 type VI secretion system FHA domain protein [Thiorhodovibrio frisius]
MASPTTKIHIGRDPRCEIALNHHTVSSQHAELSFLGDGKLLLTDCRSRNGTFLIAANGQRQRLHQALVSPMDQVDFGEARLRVREILEAWRLKSPAAASKTEAPSEPEPTPAPALGEPLERCDCGAIKAVGGTCPACGQ